MTITKNSIEKIQESWGKGVIEIGQAWAEGKNYRLLATEFIEKHYGYAEGEVLFKPTLAADEQFRGTLEKALSYFIGAGASAEDNGFALRPWIKVVFENTGIIIDGNHALAMGNYFFTDTKGEEVKVEFSFGYFIDKKGNIKINLHHSSLPYVREK